MTSRRFAFLAGGILIAAVLTRFVGLGVRFFHHDESVHAWMAYQIAKGAGYHYDPVYHGPLLYHLEAVVFRLLGAGNVQARLVPAASGVVLVALLLFLLRARLGDTTALVAAALAVVSPSLTYYSRFDSHDMLIAALTLVMIATPFDYRRTGLMWFAGALGLAICTKLNAYFVLGSLVLYLVARATYGRLTRRQVRFLDYCGRHPWDLALGAAFTAALIAVLSISTVLYDAVVMHESLAASIVTTLDTVVLGGFRYWWAAHRVARLDGPFHFYLPILFLYEPLFFLGAPIALVFYMERRVWFAGTLVALLALEWALTRVMVIQPTLPGPSTIQAWHVLLASAWLLAGAWAVVSLWLAQREFLACWTFVGILQLVLYSYANEKVPWLVVHILLPWLVVVSACLTDFWQAQNGLTARVALVVLVVLVEGSTARASWIVNTRNRSNLVEPLLQVDYTPAVADLEQQVTHLVHASDHPVTVSIEPFPEWPFGWYFRDLNVTYLKGPVSPDATADLLIAEDRPLPPSFIEPYTRWRLPYERWTTWVQDVNEGDLAGLLRFMVHHDHWGRDDHNWISVWTRKDLQVQLTDGDSPTR